jgi:hypothetical protein
MASHPKFSLSLVTPEGAAFEGEAEMVIVPGAAGEIGVLARHAPLVAMLNAGSTRVYLDVDSSDVRTFERTGDELWLERARAFAVHALEQAQALPPRYSLFTGGIGAALFAVDCLEGKARFPIVEGLRP